VHRDAGRRERLRRGRVAVPDQHPLEGGLLVADEDLVGDGLELIPALVVVALHLPGPVLQDEPEVAVLLERLDGGVADEDLPVALLVRGLLDGEPRQGPLHPGQDLPEEGLVLQDDFGLDGSYVRHFNHQ